MLVLFYHYVKLVSVNTCMKHVFLPENGGKNTRKLGFLFSTLFVSNHGNFIFHTMLFVFVYFVDVQTSLMN